MVKIDTNTKAQGWELEVICKNKEYLSEIISAILKYGMINFDVEVIDYHPYEDSYECSYSVFMYCSWFHNLANLANDLSEIEARLDKI